MKIGGSEVRKVKENNDCAKGALKLLETGRFDALISDLGLPDSSGYELVRQAKQRQPLKGIALSGFGMENDVNRARAAGFAEHLTKPINFDRLEASIQSLLDRESPIES